MIVRIFRKGSEIFSVASVEGNALSFPYGTRVERIVTSHQDAQVFLAEPPAEEPGSPEPSYAERVLVGSGKFIYAIKSYRTRTGCGLRDAKLKMDELRERMEREGERY